MRFRRAALAFALALTAGESPAFSSDRLKEFLRDLLYTRQEVNDWLTGKAFPFSRYDPELGYLHRNRRLKEGIHGSYSTYTYDRWDARQMVNHADLPCRINTYGDSFTSSEQVNDGETWQEQLAANIGEPVRNYGIGGYSVYLTYLRMKREEARRPAEYIIFNIFDDDHYRNLISWQRITSRKQTKSFHPPLPYIVANPATGQFVEMPNPCPTPEALFQLCDLEWVYENFKDDFVLRIRLTREQDKTADTLYTKAAIFASMQIVKRVEEFAASQGRKVLYVLSYGPTNVAKALEGASRFDQPFIDFLRSNGLRYVDLLQEHVADYAQFKTGARPYLDRYFIGHYSPAGNAFYAAAVRDALVAMLQPKPPAYRDR